MFRTLSNARAVTGESPIWDDRRNCVWWIDIQGQRLLGTALSGDDIIDVALPSMPGLVALAEDDQLVIGLEDGLWTVIPETGDCQLLARFEDFDPRLRANDGKADASGRLYFGVMDKTGGGARIGAILRFDASIGLERIIEGLVTPNAICPTQNSRGFYFADTADRSLVFATVDAVGEKVVDQSSLVRFGADELPDGMSLDANGSLWLAQIGKGRIARLDQHGTMIDFLELPVSRPTMPAFVGPELDHLVVTTQRRLLGFDQLQTQPLAGQLLVAQAPTKGLLANRVRLYP